MPKDRELLPVADGGLLDRRLFLKRGVSFLPQQLPLLLNCSQNQRAPGRCANLASLSNYGHPSPFEQATIRWTMGNAMSPGNGVSWTPLHDLEGIVTPNGLHFERHHNGVPEIDPKQHKLLIHGLVNNALVFTIDDLLRYPMQSRFCFIECEEEIVIVPGGASLSKHL